MPGLLDWLTGPSEVSAPKTTAPKTEAPKTEPKSESIVQAVERAIVGKVERKPGMSYFVDKEGHVREHKLGGKKKAAST